MSPRKLQLDTGVIHLERRIRAAKEVCFRAFGSTASLRRWYDPQAQLTGFRAGGEVQANYFPGYGIVAYIRHQLLVLEFTSVIDGLGIWSFVPRGENCIVVFDHIAAGNTGTEFHARTFHWQGLMENLAAVCERRAVPFIEGVYVGALPRGIRFASCPAYVKSKGSRSLRRKVN